MLILGAAQVREVLDGAEDAVLRAVRQAYILHALGETAVPHSVFLRFPDNTRDRIIALPAYLGTDTPVAGVKWVSSFPGNIDNGRDRASAAMILSSMSTGAPEVFLEASTISARRTAASAALAAATLPAAAPDTAVTLIGCGLINFEVLRFLRVTLPGLREVTLFDLNRDRADAFALRCTARWPELRVGLADTIAEAMAAHPLICLATTAGVPHLDTAACAPSSLLLHLSLRDLIPASIRSAVNIVDDADHVCRAATSLHLAEQETGYREFITASLGELLLAGDSHPRATDRITVFSPFGLGVLDLAVADLVQRAARDRGIGIDLPDFLPVPEPVPVPALR